MPRRLGCRNAISPPSPIPGRCASFKLLSLTNFSTTKKHIKPREYGYRIYKEKDKELEKVLRESITQSNVMKYPLLHCFAKNEPLIRDELFSIF